MAEVNDRRDSADTATTTASELRVANTILEQLGGRQFVAMTGARNLLGDAQALSFKLPANFAKDGINYVRISLDPDDTYTVRFTRLGRAPTYKLHEIKVREGVYADDLRDVFTRATGLDTSLGAGPARVSSQPRAVVADRAPSAHVANATPLSSAAPDALSLSSRILAAFALPRTYPAVRDALLMEDPSLSRETVDAAFAASCDARALIACGTGTRADTLYRVTRGPAAVADVEQKIREHVGAEAPNAVAITWEGGLVTHVQVHGKPIAESDWKRLRMRGLVDMIWVPDAWHGARPNQVFVKGRWLASPHAAGRFRVASAAPPRRLRASTSAAPPMEAPVAPGLRPSASPPIASIGGAPSADASTPIASRASELPVWLRLHQERPRADPRDRSLSQPARRLYQVLQRQAERQTGARWETPFLLDLDAAAETLGERRGDLVHTLALLNLARLVALAEAPPSRSRPNTPPPPDAPATRPLSLPGSARTVEPSPSGSPPATIPADAAPEPPITAVATPAGPEVQLIRARYGDLAVHRARDAAGHLVVTHEGTGIAIAIVSPRRPGSMLDPAVLREALAFAWDVSHRPGAREALDALMRVVPPFPTKRAFDAAIAEHGALLDAWREQRDRGDSGRLGRYFTRVRQEPAAVVLPTRVLLPERTKRPEGLLAAGSLLSAVEQQAIAQVGGPWQTPFRLDLEDLALRLGITQGQAVALLRVLLACGLVRDAGELAPDITAAHTRSSLVVAPARRAQSLFASAAAALASSPAAVDESFPRVGKRLSRTQIASSGWTRVDPRPWTKTFARWRHPSGWRLEHCGHPTALQPWALYAPGGEMILMGALGTPPNPALGTAWVTLGDAITFVADVLAGRRVLPTVAPAAAPHEPTHRAPTGRARSPFAAVAAALVPSAITRAA